MSKKYRYHGIVNRQHFVAADTVTDLKRKASIAVNGYMNVTDSLTVFDRDNKTHFSLHRINKKCPWNVILYGSWK